jgi:cytochrome c oxidase subunit II
VDSQTAPDTLPNETRENRARNTVKGAVAITLIVLFALMFISFRTGSAINTLSRAEEPLSLKITGNQWWWNVEYQDVIPSNNITTANELHLPVGRPVKVEIQSNDVIHSIWLPNMHGKKDLVPNYPTMFYFRPDKVGTYWGQCAEFCGYQHAKMALTLVAEPPDSFAAWLTRQRQAASPPTDSVARRGLEVFLGSTCATCHTITGTPAGGRVGPDLTHLASRRTIAAGTLPNTRGNLAGWILDPQGIKPGAKMPPTRLEPADLQALLTYLETLR